MRKEMKKESGFTMVELLVVLIIVAILAAVATPLYLSNVQRSRASEAVSAMGLIRQALRDYRVNHSTYFDITGGTSTTSNIELAPPNGLSIPREVTSYFSNHSYSVDATSPAFLSNTNAANPNNPVDFLIIADGDDSFQCGGSDTSCATKRSEVLDYDLQMDNSGRVFVSYDEGASWQLY